MPFTESVSAALPEPWRMWPVSAEDTAPWSRIDRRVEAHQRGLAGEEDRSYRRAGPRDLQTHLRRGVHRARI